MNATYEKKKAMTFIGYHTEIRPDEGYVKCPEFWEKEYNQKYARLWQTMKPETPVEKAILENHIGMFAICAESENGFDYWIAGLYQGGEVPDGLELYAFPESSWAVFSAKGPMPKALQGRSGSRMKDRRCRQTVWRRSKCTPNAIRSHPTANAVFGCR